MTLSSTSLAPCDKNKLVVCENGLHIEYFSHHPYEDSMKRKRRREEP